MAFLLAKITDDARIYLPRLLGGIPYVPGTPTVLGSSTWDPRIKFFRVGEGGWQLSGISKVQRLPVSNLRRFDNSVQDIDARVDTTRLAAGQPERYEGNPLNAAYSRGNFQKALTSGDFSFVAPSRLNIRCRLEAAEFNEDSAGSGRSPEIWEVGVFGDHPTVAGEALLWAYGTLTEAVPKTAASAREFNMLLVF